MAAGDVTNLWLAEALFRLGGVKFGSFTLGRSTVDSPIYVVPKVLLREPRILARVANIELGAGRWWLDSVRRMIPEHPHWHARGHW